MDKQTRLIDATDAGLEEAASLLRAGALVAFPTETVYGLGGDATNARAVAEIFAAKGRPQFNPLIVHVADIAAAEHWAIWNDHAAALAAAFWPGPLTFVLPARPDTGLSRLVQAGLDSVALRLPSHPVAQALLSAVGRPLAAPSANPSGRISPTTAAHVMAGLSGRIDAVLDGGPCAVGVESTIVDLRTTPRLLRPGGLPVEALEAALGAPLRAPDTSGTITAPGQLSSHYAPRARIRLNARSCRDDEVLLGFGPVANAKLNLSPAGDLIEAAARLFDCLHQLDDAGAETIAVTEIPDHGLGRAINDRLRRAAAPRN